MTVLLKVKEIGSAKHKSDKFVFVPLYFLYRDKSKQLVYAQIDQELQLVNGLRANMLIWNNIVGREQISINIAERTALVASYGVCIPISARQRSQPLIKKVLNANAMTLLPRTETFVSVLSIGFPDNQDFFFQPLTKSCLTLFLHLVDDTIGGVLVCNESQHVVRLPCKQKLGLVTEVLYKTVSKLVLILTLPKCPQRLIRSMNLTKESGFPP